jgi:antitoxin HicB
MAKNKHLGSTLDEFLDEEGLTEEVDAIVQKRVLAEQLREAMKAHRISEVGLARRMATSRTVVRNLLDPNNDSATLVTMARAANAVGRRLSVTLEPRSGRAREVLRRGRSAHTRDASTYVTVGTKARSKQPAARRRRIRDRVD